MRHKPQEHQQLLPAVLSRDIRGWAPSVSHCLIACSQIEFCSLNLPHSQTLYQTRCLSRSLVESYQHKTRLIGIRPVSVHLNCWRARAQKKSWKLLDFFFHKMKTYTLLQLPLWLSILQVFPGLEGIAQFWKRSRSHSDWDDTWIHLLAQNPISCQSHFQIRKKKKPVGSERFLHYHLLYYVVHLFSSYKNHLGQK